MPEVEAKFIVRRPEQVDDVLRLIEALGYRVAESRQVAQVDTYFDTDDLSIQRAGWAYRCRQCGDERTLVLKSAGKGRRAVFIREEIEQPLPTGFRPGSRTLPGGPVADRLKEIVNDRDLQGLFTVETDRTVFAVTGDAGEPVSLELDLDQTRIAPKKAKLSGPGKLEFTELELELREGDAQHVRGLAARLVEQGHLAPAHYSKFDRGLWAAGIRGAADAVAQDKRRFHGKDSFVDLLYWYLRQRLESLQRHYPIAWEGIHPEGVHKMRVAIRRTRAMLAAFDDIFPQPAAATLDSDLRWLAKQLGFARDADVCEMAIDSIVAKLPPELAAAIGPYADFLRQESMDAYTNLNGVLGGRRYRSVVAKLERLAAAGPPRSRSKGSGGLTIAKASTRYVKPAIRKALRRGDRIGGQSTAAELHKLRIRAKRLRYLLDLFSIGQPRKWQAAIANLAKLQDLLGEHQDACTARQRLDDFAKSSPDDQGCRHLWLAVGRLMQREDDRIASCRRRFPAAWSRFRKAVG